MAWEFGNGQKILIGSNITKGFNVDAHLTGNTLAMLHRRGYFFLYQIIKTWESGCQIWKEAEDLNLGGSSALERKAYVLNLSWTSLCYSSSGDNII